MRGTEQAEPAFLRATMRALVREDRAALVWLGAERGDESGPRPGNAVRPHVILREEPVDGLRLPGEHALLAPGGEVTSGLRLVVGEGQVDDVVGAAGEQVGALVGADDVVGRSDEGVERPGLRFVVAERPKRRDRRHHLRLP